MTEEIIMFNKSDVESIEEAIKRLEQENKELKKQIESQKGLITVGGKQQYEYLQRVDKLEQENKKLLEARNHFMGVNLKYFNALEEIRILATKNVSIENFVKIQNKINEALNEN